MSGIAVTYLRKLLAVFLFFKLLPVPIDLDVLLVGLDHFILDLVGSLLFILLFRGAALLVESLSLRLDANDRLFSLSTDLLEHTCPK